MVKSLLFLKKKEFIENIFVLFRDFVSNKGSCFQTLMTTSNRGNEQVCVLSFTL